MPGIVIALFWIWTAISVVILLHRVFTTGTLRPGGKKERPEPLTVEEPVDRVAEFEAKLAAQAPPEPVTAVPAPAIAPDPGAADIPRAETLAEALTGIQMPADLAPLVGDVVNPRRMLFTTGTASPETVGGALADELERLGFRLQPLDERSVAASRPDAAVEVRILPTVADARATIGDRLDTVPEHAVITEFHLR